MSLFGPPNIEKLKSNNDVDGLIRALNYKLKDKSQKSEDINVRKDAAIALGEIKNLKAVKPLSNIAGIESEDILVRHVAVTALGEIGGTEAASGLLETLLDINTSDESIESLARIGAPAVDPLVGFFLNIGNLSNKYGMNSYPAGRFGTLYGARGKILKALAMIGRPSVDSLMHIFDDYCNTLGEDIMLCVVDALGVICTRLHDRTLNERVAKLMISKTGDRLISNMYIVRFVGHIGVSFEDPTLNKQVMDLLINQLGSSYESDTSQRILIELGPTATEPLIAALGNEKSDKYHIANILAQIGEKRALEAIIEALSKSDTSYLVGRSLKQLGWQPDKSIAGAAYWACERQWDKCIEIGNLAEGPLCQVLAEEIFAAESVQIPIIQALGKIGGERAALEIFRVFFAHLFYKGGYENWPRRLIIIEALKQIGKPALTLLQSISQKQYNERQLWIDGRGFRFDVTHREDIHVAAGIALTEIQIK
jgi:HEAT repeat protein